MQDLLDHGNTTDFNIHFPATNDLDQDQEYFEFIYNGTTRRLRLHDYADIYKVPGLYEALVYDKLQCQSPARVAELIQSVLVDWPRDPEDLRVLDLGAGNGIMAEELRKIGVKKITGLDLLPEAKTAAERDRPEVYDNYFVADLTDLPNDTKRSLEKAKFNSLVTVAALGFGDIPPEAFATAFNLVEDSGWVAMTIKEDFLHPTADSSGFSRLVRVLVNEGILEIQAHHRYCHRLSIQGEQLFYLVLLAKKTADIGLYHLSGINPENPEKSNGFAARVHAPNAASLLLNNT